MSEQDSAQASEVGAARCELLPPFVPGFQPELQWEWTGSPVMPTHRNVMMTPVVVDLDKDGTPDILFNSYYNNPQADGVLRAISGKDGHDLWAVTDPAYRLRPSSALAVGDIDNDGLVEVCGIPENGRGVLCFENDGTFKFRTTVPFNNWGGVSLADLDGDGTVEILDGNYVLDHNGAVKWVGSDGPGGTGVGSVSFAADLDLDGLQEVINDRAVYRYDGTLKCANTSIGHGLAAVGNFNADPYGEIAVAWKGHVSLLDHNCALLWTSLLPDGAGSDSGAPTVADFDNDGQPEIGVASESAYTVYKADGRILWSSPTRDLSSASSGATVFDFEGDGHNEVVYADEAWLRIYDGATGAVRYQTPHSSGTTFDNPIVADVDGDNAAEIVVAENSYFRGIRVYHDHNEGWVSTRRIWNQHAYSVSNVNDDGTIPAHPKTSWLQKGLNAFRANAPGKGGKGAGNGTPAPDLVAFAPAGNCDRATMSLALSARVLNQGEASTAAPVQVAFYQGNPSSGGTLLGVGSVPALGPGQEGIATISVVSPDTGPRDVLVVADDDGTGHGHLAECVESNNTAVAHLDLTCVWNLPPVAVCRDVRVSAGPTCSAAAHVNNGSYDPDNGPSPLVVTEAPPGPYGLGSHPVIVTAYDGAASSTCSGTVTVVDDTPPTVVCPSATVLECKDHGAVATYAATATDNCSAVTPTCDPASGKKFPVGTTPVTCSATDGSGNKGSCGFTVTVRDTQPPVAGASLGLSLWPPNHKYVNVLLSDCAADAVDACGGTISVGQSGHIAYVTSDEVENDNGVGAGNTCVDMVINANGSVDLRAEREGTSDGRVYTLHYTIADPSGNTTAASCKVSVPHDQSGRIAVDTGAVYCVGQGCPAGTVGNSPTCR